MQVRCANSLVLDIFSLNMLHDQPMEESPVVNALPNEEFEHSDDIPAEPTTTERVEPIVSQYLAKSAGRHPEKNMFYPNKTAASVLYGKSIPEVTTEIDEKIRRNPSLQVQRMKLINEERSNRWNSLNPAQQKLWIDKAQEFNDLPPNFGTVECVRQLRVT